MGTDQEPPTHHWNSVLQSYFLKGNIFHQHKNFQVIFWATALKVSKEIIIFSNHTELTLSEKKFMNQATPNLSKFFFQREKRCSTNVTWKFFKSSLLTIFQSILYLKSDLHLTLQKTWFLTNLCTRPVEIRFQNCIYRRFSCRCRVDLS